MSWDADLVCDSCGHTAGDWNYTHNVAPMIQEARRSIGHQVDESWWKVLDGMPAPVGACYLSDIIAALEADPTKYRAMNPPNGWGSYDNLLPVLRTMRDCSTVEVPMTWRCGG